MIYINIDREELENAIKDLNIPQRKLNHILKNAINRTAKHMKEQLPKEANERYRIRRLGRVKRSLELKKAKVNNPEAIITSTGDPNDLYDFNVTSRRYTPMNRPKAGPKANVLRANSPVALMLKPSSSKDKYKAFVVKYKSKHVAIAQRVPGKKMKSDPKKELIKNLYSTSTPAMLGYEDGVFGKVSRETEELLSNEVAKEIERYLKT